MINTGFHKTAVEPFFFFLLPSLSCSDDAAASEKTVLHIAEETDDDLLASTPATHTTEDLFTIIHRFAPMFTQTHVHSMHSSYIFYCTIVFTNNVGKVKQYTTDFFFF